MADKWYDVNGVFEIMFRNGYIPLVNSQRQGIGMYGEGKKARKIWSGGGIGIGKVKVYLAPLQMHLEIG